MIKVLQGEAPNNASVGLSVREASSWTDFSYFRWKGIDRPASRIGKINLEKFLSQNQLPHLKVLQVFDSAKQIDFGQLPDSFVLKPAALWSGVGVMLLHKIPNHFRYFDAKSNRIYTAEEVKIIAEMIERKMGKSLQFIAEERAVDEDSLVSVPFDYKVFAFHGVTKFVLQVDRNHPKPRMAFFDGDFQPIRDERVMLPVTGRSEVEGSHRIPKCAADMLILAKEITLKLKSPFISVDCYATERGAVFGELTHTPGGPWFGSLYRFSDEFDHELGAAWKNACQRLKLPIRNISIPYDIKTGDKLVRTVF